MKLKYNNEGSYEYVNAPEGMHTGVIVDMLPPFEQDSQYGRRTVTRFVIEINKIKNEKEGWRFTLRTKPMTLKLAEKSALYQFAKDVLGRDLTAEEKEEFDPETLIGSVVDVVVKHVEQDGKIYDNIAYLGKSVNPNPEVWESTYVRVEDRDIQVRDPSPAELAEMAKDAPKDEKPLDLKEKIAAAMAKSKKLATK